MGLLGKSGSRGGRAKNDSSDTREDWNPRNQAFSAKIELKPVLGVFYPASIQSYPLLLPRVMLGPDDSSRRTVTTRAREASRRSLPRSGRPLEPRTSLPDTACSTDVHGRRVVYRVYPG